MQLGRAPAYVEPAGEDAFVAEAVAHAFLHGVPELQQPGADLRLAAPGLLVGQHQLADTQVVLPAELQQFLGAGEVVGQLGVVLVQLAGLGLGFVDDEAAADGVVGVAVQFTGLAFDDQGHGVGVVGQVFLQQQQVAAPVEGHRVAAVQQQLAGGLQGFDARGDLLRVDPVGPFAHQPHQRGAVGAVADAGGRQRAVQAHLDARHLVQQPALAQRRGEQRRRAHRAHGVRAGGADTDLEQVEHADSHAGSSTSGSNLVGANSFAMQATGLPLEVFRGTLRVPFANEFAPTGFSRPGTR
ncbi:hypothetical protein D9M70_303190 [compost metagenome]